MAVSIKSCLLSKNSAPKLLGISSGGMTYSAIKHSASNCSKKTQQHLSQSSMGGKGEGDKLFFHSGFSGFLLSNEQNKR